MEFYLNDKKCFGNTIYVLIDVLENMGLEFTLYDCEILIDKYINNEFPQKFYKNKLLNIDEFKKDPECIYDIID